MNVVDLAGDKITRKAYLGKILILMNAYKHTLTDDDILTKLAFKQLLSWCTKGCPEEKLLVFNTGLATELKQASIASEIPLVNKDGRKAQEPQTRVHFIAAIITAIKFACSADLSDLFELLDTLDEIPIDGNMCDEPRPQTLAEALETEVSRAIIQQVQ